MVAIEDVGQRPTYGPGLTRGEIDAVRHYGAALVVFDEQMAVLEAMHLRGCTQDEMDPHYLRREAARLIRDEALAALGHLLRQRFVL